MTIVVKLGSSIVADERGEVRADVLDSVCAQVAELHHAGEDVAMVTSGAVARGTRGHGRPPLDVVARSIDLEGLEAASFDLVTPEVTRRVRIGLPGLYNVYNAPTSPGSRSATCTPPRCC